MLSSRFLKQSLVTASVITITANVLSRVFGYFREAAIANYFGTTEIFDVFILAFTVPELVAAIIFTVLPLALIPSLRRDPVKGDAKDPELFWSGLSAFVIVMAVTSILIYFARGHILQWLAPKLTHSQFIDGKQLIGILSWLVFFRGMEAYFRSWLFEKKHFIIPATSNIILNVIILAAIFSLFGKLGIKSLAYGWLGGSVVLCIYTGFFALLVVKPSAKIEINNYWIMILLRSTLAIAAVQCLPLLYPVIDRYLAAKYLAPGQIAALRYAFILIQIPTGIFVATFNITSFPWVSDYSVPGQLNELRELYKKGVRLLIYIMGLMAVGVVIFSKEIVKVAFQRGAFDVNSMILTSGPLMFYALGIVFYSIYIFQIRMYYGRQTLMKLGTILFMLLILKLVLSLALVGPMAQNGLALATTITWVCGLALMSIDVGRTLRISLRNLLYPSVLKTLLMMAIVAIYWIVIKNIWGLEAVDRIMILFFRLSILAVSGAGLYFGSAFILHHPEQKMLFYSITSRLRRFRGES